VTNLRRRLRKLELHRQEHRLDTQPEGYWKRLLMERLEVMSQRLQAARDRGEYVPQVDVGEVKQRLRAFLEDMKKRSERT
jgi:hypothetical protein